MNVYKEAKLNMYHLVIDLCENNLAIVALVAAFATSYNVFKTTVAAIVSGMTILEAQTGGLSTSKQTAKRTLATMGSGIAGMVSAYASVTGDETLEEAMDISFSKINAALDDEVESICMNIYTAANDNLASLGDYGVTAPLLATFQTAIDDYGDKKPKPQASQANKKMVRAQVAALFKDADKTLKKQMDKLAVNFLSNGNEEFEGQYRASRVLINAGSFATVLKILVLNSANNEPLRSAKVYRDASGTFKRTTKKGFVTYKDIEQGAHSFIVKHKLFDDAALSNVMIASGKKHEATVLMNPKGAGNSLVFEGDVAPALIKNIPLPGLNPSPATMVIFEISGSTLKFYSSPNAGDAPGGVFYERAPGITTISIEEFATLLGFGGANTKLNVQNTGGTEGHYKLTFTAVQ